MHAHQCAESKSSVAGFVVRHKIVKLLSIPRSRQDVGIDPLGLWVVLFFRAELKCVRRTRQLLPFPELVLIGKDLHARVSFPNVLAKRSDSLFR